MAVVAVYASVALVGFAAMVAAWSVSFSIQFFPVGNALLKVGLAATIASFIFLWRADAIGIRERARAGSPFLLAGTAFGAWITASILWARFPVAALGRLWGYGIALGVFVALIVGLDRKSQVRLIVAAFVAGAFLTAVCGLLGIDAGPLNSLPGQSRIRGGAGDANVLAGDVLMAAVLAGGLMSCTRRSVPRLALMAAIVVFGLTLAGTESRGGAIATIVVVLVALPVMRGRRSSVLGLAVGGLAAATAWLVLSPGSAERLTNFNDHGDGRAELWRIAWEMFIAHPLQGVGLENFIPEAPNYVLHPGGLEFIHVIIEKPVVVHNIYLQFLAETGLVGLLLFLTVITLSLTATLRAANIFERSGDRRFADLCRSIFLALIALLAVGFFISSGDEYKLWALLALGPAMLILARKSPREEIVRAAPFAPPIEGAAQPPTSSRVAVIIPCFNDGATVDEAVGSLRAQEPCEVVIVNDGSDDPGTLDVLKRLQHAGVRVIHQENTGLSGARMRGVSETSAPYIYPLDADDLLGPGALTPLADLLDRDATLGMAWGDQRVFGEVDLIQRRAETLDPWAITYANRLASGLIRREALLDAGGWELAVGFEDWDLYMGLAEKGWQGRRLDLVTLHYRSSSSRMLSNARLQHDRLYGQMRSRHPRLFAERKRNWLRSSAPIWIRLLLPIVNLLPASEFTRHRIGLALSEPLTAVKVRVLRRTGRRTPT